MSDSDLCRSDRYAVTTTLKRQNTNEEEHGGGLVYVNKNAAEGVGLTKMEVSATSIKSVHFTQECLKPWFCRWDTVNGWIWFTYWWKDWLIVDWLIEGWTDCHYFFIGWFIGFRPALLHEARSHNMKIIRLEGKYQDTHVLIILSSSLPQSVFLQATLGK